MKVAIFFDGQNFYRSLLRHDESLRVDYDRLATWITEQVGGASARFSGAYYYVGVSADAPPLVEGFLKGLELRPGHVVKREPRWRRAGRTRARRGGRWPRDSRGPPRRRRRTRSSTAGSRSSSAQRHACRT